MVEYDEAVRFALWKLHLFYSQLLHGHVSILRYHLSEASFLLNIYQNVWILLSHVRNVPYPLYGNVRIQHWHSWISKSSVEPPRMLFDAFAKAYLGPGVGFVLSTFYGSYVADGIYRRVRNVFYVLSDSS